MTIPYVILALTAAAYTGFGFASALWPEMMARLTDIQLPTATAKVDFAATYGGFELGFAGFLLLSLRRPAWLESGLWAGVLTLTGFAVVRLISLILSTAPVRPAIYLALALELCGVLLNLWGLWLMRRRLGSAVRAAEPAGRP